MEQKWAKVFCSWSMFREALVIKELDTERKKKEASLIIQFQVPR